MPLRPNLAAVACAAAVLGGCASTDVKQATLATAAEVRNGPEAPPQRTITSFSNALRCMDGLMLTYGVRDVSVLVEDLADQTKKVNAGAKDMLISAVSEMNRRSGAVRLVTFGRDTGSTAAFMQEAGRKSAYAAVPSYGIKGSVTQFDENVGKKKADGGAGISPYFNIGAAKDATASILALDLSVFATEDFAVVPGVTSRNSVLILREARGVDAEASIRKFGVNYSMSLSKAEGQSQALRTLIELAAVELLGKLTKTPYWSCLGSDPQGDEIAQEVSDWFASLYARPQLLVGWFQNQLRARRYYRGPVDGELNDEFRAAVIAYRSALGLSAEPRINLEFFSAYLRADHRKVVAAAPPPAATASAAAPADSAAQAPAAPAAATAVATPPSGAAADARRVLALAIVGSAGDRPYARGERLQISVRPSRDAHVFCYLQDEKQQIVRFFPNRFARDALVRADAPLTLPGRMRFELVANRAGLPETIACFAADRDVLPQLAHAAVGNDFEPLPVRNLDEVKAAFAACKGVEVAESRFGVRVR